MRKVARDQPLFRDRADAGVRLASALTPTLSGIGSRDLVVLGLARGGIPVAFEIARFHGATLDACSIRKIGAPGQPELAIGAVGPGRVRYLYKALIRDLGLSPATVRRLSSLAAEERDLIDNLLRDGRAATPLKDKIVVLADDGLATGASMRVAMAAVAKQHPKRTIIAVPVAPPQVTDEFRAHGFATIALIEPGKFHAVGLWYDDFAPVSVDTVRDLLEACSRSLPKAAET